MRNKFISIPSTNNKPSWQRESLFFIQNPDIKITLKDKKIPQVINAVPSHQTLLNLLSNLYDSQEFQTLLTETNKYLDESLSNMFSVIRLLFFRGISLINLGQKSAALDDFNQALALQPNDTNLKLHLLYLAGLTQFSLRNTFAATQDFLAATKIFPQGIEQFINKVYQISGDTEEFLKQKITEKPDKLENYFLLALHLLSKSTDNFSKAKKVLDSAFDYQNHNIFSLNSLLNLIELLDSSI